MLTEDDGSSNRQKDRYDGDDLRRMLTGGTAAIEASARSLDALNVFPVPDGDTGANMLLTLRAAETALQAYDGNSASAVSSTVARGALMGGRGNSGVILSQFLRGFADELAGHETFTTRDFVRALRACADSAYKAVTSPVEGTMLTVARRIAEAAEAALQVKSGGGSGPSAPSPLEGEGRGEGDALSHVLQAAIQGADAAVAETPSLLPLLKQAGVVDAGGQSLAVFLKGAYAAFANQPPPEPLPMPATTSELHQVRAEAEFRGFCCEFIVEAVEADSLRERLKAMGDSILVVGDGQLNHVHIHTEEPQEVLAFAQTIGPVSHTKVQDMREQRQDLLADETATPTIAVVAVVSGHGMEQVYRSLGAHRLIPGGATMNPSVEQIAEAIESAPADRVIVLPNNGNIIPAAHRALEMSSKRAEVIPTKVMTEGIAALLALDPDGDLAANAEGMAESARAVRTIGVTWATRNVTWGEVLATAGQAIAVIGDDLLAAGDQPVDVALAALRATDLAAAEVITIYAGGDAPLDEAEQVRQSAAQNFPDLAIELVEGGQPHYRYLIAIE